MLKLQVPRTDSASNNLPRHNVVTPHSDKEAVEAMPRPDVVTHISHEDFEGFEAISTNIQSSISGEWRLLVTADMSIEEMTDTTDREFEFGITISPTFSFTFVTI